jgi:hypothetical protein
MALRLVYADGYTNYGLGAPHPNGTVYFAVQANGKQRKVIILRRNLNGTHTEVKRYTQGVDFQGTAGICQAIPMPDGAVLVSFPATYADNVARYEDTIPNGCPPFTPSAIYQYPASAVDTVARQNSEAAVQTAQRAERNSTEAKADVKTNGAKVEARIAEVVTAAQKAIAGMSVQAVVIALKGQLNNTSDLAAFIWSKARDASYLHLKETGLIK